MPGMMQRAQGGGGERRCACKDDLHSGLGSEIRFASQRTSGPLSSGSLSDLKNRSENLDGKGGFR
jgi:hypothetical protein